PRRVRGGARAVARAARGRVVPRQRLGSRARNEPGVGRARGTGQLPGRGAQVSDPRAEFLARAERGGVVPLVREVLLDADTAVAAFAKVARPPFAFLVESAMDGERWAA